jgi:hypothetical protein
MALQDVEVMASLTSALIRVGSSNGISSWWYSNRPAAVRYVASCAPCPQIGLA